MEVTAKVNSDPCCLTECQIEVGGSEESQLLYSNAAFFCRLLPLVVPLASLDDFESKICKKCPRRIRSGLQTWKMMKFQQQGTKFALVF